MSELAPGAFDHSAGIWVQLPADPSPLAGRPALFLDRDGTVVKEVRYLHTAEDTRLVEGAAEVIAAANRNRVATVIVTNQAGIGRGYYGWPEFQRVQGRILRDLKGCGAAIDAVFACPYHADAEPPYRHPDHPARKPNPGMLQTAASVLGLDLARSWIIGNYDTDLAAGRAAGCAGGVHLAVGHGAEPDQADLARALATPAFTVVQARAIGEALDAVPILGGRSRDAMDGSG